MVGRSRGESGQLGGLDETDAELVAALQADGRASFTTLAERVELSRPAARARVQRLIDEGQIRIITVVHASVLGIDAFAHVSVSVEGSARRVAEEIAHLPEAAFVSLTAGEYPLIVELRAADDRSLSLGMNRIRSISQVRGTNVLRYSQLVKDAYSLVAEPSPVQLDEIDRRLLELLQADGRASFADLAADVELSQTAVRARVLNLLDSGVVRVTALPMVPRPGLAGMCSFGARVTGPVDDVARAIAKVGGVIYLACVFGRYDVLGGVVGTTRSELLQGLEEIRATAGVRGLETWHHLDIVKETYDAPAPEPEDAYR